MSDQQRPDETGRYRVVQEYGWSYVVAADGRFFGYSGPYRYREDAQEYCDELNGVSVNG